MKQVPRVTPALVFLQTSLNRWQGRLVLRSLCVDKRTGMPAESPRFDISEDPRTGKCRVLVQGATHHGRRYVSYPNLDAAQAGGNRWARRRFTRVED
jgi:hypothetical protein